MSLSSILDEIQSGAVRTDEEGAMTEVTGAVAPAMDTALEHLQGIKLLQTRAAELGNNLRLNRSLQDVLQGKVLERGAALELFTMLAPQGGVRPVFTQTPSRHNRDTLLGYVDRTGLSDTEHLAFVQDVLVLLDKSESISQEIESTARGVTLSIEAELVRLQKTPPTVMCLGKGVNLLTVSLSEVAGMDTSALDFAPYEGTLDVRFREVLRALESLAEKNPSLFSSLRGSTFTLESVCDRLLHLSHAASQCNEEQRRMTAGLQAVRDGHAAYSVFLVEETLESLIALQSLHQLFLQRDGVAQKTVDCLRFLV